MATNRPIDEKLVSVAETVGTEPDPPIPANMKYETNVDFFTAVGSREWLTMNGRMHKLMHSQCDCRCRG